jgi:hypothetical protein
MDQPRREVGETDAPAEDELSRAFSTWTAADAGI